jgi:hypothetical protein
LTIGRAPVAAALAASLAAALGIAAGGFSPRQLVVEEGGRSRVLHRERVTPGATFTLDYRHSSEGVPVRGTFRVDIHGTVTPVETAFGGFGPGLPELTSGDDWRIADGLIVHRPPPRALADLRLRMTAISRPRLTMPSGRELDLIALAGRSAAVIIRVK